jgi:intracellular sulfur oxidation DsrE/DsrF family protein
MKNLLLHFLLFTALSFSALAGNSLFQKGHKIVFQLQQADTLVQKTLMKQINNILTISPDTKIEVVCHGPGLALLLKDKTIVSDKLEKMVEKGVVFNACEFTMKERKIEKSDLVSVAKTVPAGIIEIVTKQEEGWSYIKAGF